MKENFQKNIWRIKKRKLHSYYHLEAFKKDQIFSSQGQE